MSTTLTHPDILAVTLQMQNRRDRLARASATTPGSGRAAATGPEGQGAGSGMSDSASLVASLLDEALQGTRLHFGAQIAQELVADQAQKHPIRLLALGAATGAAVVALRPWEWVKEPTLVALLGPHIETVIQVFAQATPSDTTTSFSPSNPNESSP